MIMLSVDVCSLVFPSCLEDSPNMVIGGRSCQSEVSMHKQHLGVGVGVDWVGVVATTSVHCARSNKHFLIFI